MKPNGIADVGGKKATEPDQRLQIEAAGTFTARLIAMKENRQQRQSRNSRDGENPAGRPHHDRQHNQHAAGQNAVGHAESCDKRRHEGDCQPRHRRTRSPSAINRLPERHEGQAPRSEHHDELKFKLPNEIIGLS